MNVLQQAYLLGSAINILPSIEEIQQDFVMYSQDTRCCAGCCAPCGVLMSLKSSGELDKIFSEAYVDGMLWAAGFSWWQDGQVSLKYLQNRIMLNCWLCIND